MQLQPGNASTFRIFFANFSFKFEKVTSTESIRPTFCCRYFFPPAGVNLQIAQPGLQLQNFTVSTNVALHNELCCQYEIGKSDGSSAYFAF